MTYFIAVSTAIVLTGCCAVKCPTSPLAITYKEANYDFFVDGRSPDLKEFNDTTKKAVEGNNPELIRILAWASLTDGEGSLDYAEYLLKLQRLVGEKRFIEAFENLPPEEQGIVKSLITTNRKLEKFTKTLDTNLGNEE
jgi:hypothetical protein